MRSKVLRNGLTVTMIVYLWPVVTAAATRTWDGGGVDELASRKDNWSDNTLPGSSDDIVLDTTSANNVNWNGGADTGDGALPASVNSWAQSAGYSGTVTVYTVYGASGFTNFSIANDLTINGGVWTHQDQGGSATAVNRLRATVGGSLTLGAGGTIDGSGVGFDGVKGEGRGLQVNSKYYQAASHGGLGGFALAAAGYAPATTYVTYGSITEPETLGSGGSGGLPTYDYLGGGGAVYLDVVGTATIDGTIRANGNDQNTVNFTVGAGGSVYLRAGDLISATGTIEARGADHGKNHGSSTGGGGGRIAVIVTNGLSIDPDLTLNARGGASAYTLYYESHVGAAGTIYTETKTQSGGNGVLIVDNADQITHEHFAKTEQTPAVDYTGFSEIVVQNKGHLGISSNDTFDFSLGTLAGEDSASAAVTVDEGADVTFGADFYLEDFTLMADGVTNFEGNVTITNGVLTHTKHARFASDELYSINAVINGTLTVDATGSIDVTGKGFAPASGPGKGSTKQAGSYGGLGGLASAQTPGATYITYGSILAPTNLGSGATTVFQAVYNYGGGGVVILDVEGDTVLDGDILSSAFTVSANNSGMSSGGSVSLITDTLTGSGTINVVPQDVNSGKTSYAGGGGRIAVVLRTGENFGSVSME
ncbi:MAG: hypothetical protein HQ559_10205, partial [Lentisphaerae bacterium]|nr:hypothetical protein [Lentisphaerota bacterium]